MEAYARLIARMAKKKAKKSALSYKRAKRRKRRTKPKKRKSPKILDKTAKINVKGRDKKFRDRIAASFYRSKRDRLIGWMVFSAGLMVAIASMFYMRPPDYRPHLVIFIIGGIFMVIGARQTNGVRKFA